MDPVRTKGGFRECEELLRLESHTVRLPRTGGTDFKLVGRFPLNTFGCDFALIFQSLFLLFVVCRLQHGCRLLFAPFLIV